MAGVVCDRFQACPFYNRILPNMPNMAEQLMARYCRGNWSVCARKRAADIIGFDNVPDDMFPNDQARLARLIGK